MYCIRAEKAHIPGLQSLNLPLKMVGEKKILAQMEMDSDKGYTWIDYNIG